MQTLTLIAFYLVLAVSPMGISVCDSIEESGKTAVREEPTPSLNTTAAEIYYFHPDHLGSSAWVTDTLGQAVQHLGYLPWGERYISQKTGNFSTLFTFSGKERDEETGYSYFGQRFYDSQLSIWISVDPMRGKYPSLSPFVYCANNPIKLVDPNGMEINPIYDLNGNFLGTDDKGLQGEAIIMNKSDFRQGMSHEEAMAKDMSFEQSVEFANSGNLGKFLSHYSSLSSRPDWDGVVTREEGISWAKSHPGALGNPTPDNSLFIDASKLDFGHYSTEEELQIGKINPVKTLTARNFLKGLKKGNLQNTVYALGRVNIFLLDNSGHIEVVNDKATDYDWNKGGGFVRDMLIRIERIFNGLNDTHGFKTYYYGTGKLNKK